MLGPGRLWIRRRRARRLERRARTLRPAELDDSTVYALAELASGDGETRFLAVEGLAAIARNGQRDPTRDRATEALLSVLREGDDDLQAVAARSLRYVALEREPVVERLDGPFARILDRWDHAAHREVAADAGMLLARPNPRHDLPEVVTSLREALVGGPPAARGNAAVAYVLAAEHPDRFERPDHVAEHLAILGGDRDAALPPPDDPVRTLAGGRTLDDAVEAFADPG